jgi:high-affinity nickel-transport protein
MNEAVTDWHALLALVFALGFRHGLDADHLAAIDGLARLDTSSSARTGIGGFSGLLFSAGHGVVVMSMGRLGGQWQVPSALQSLGACISIGSLTVLGIANLRAAIATPRHQHVHTVSLRGGWFGPLQASTHPIAAALLGALFALSFDTMGLASLFALTGAKFGGARSALMLGATFTLGMVVVDSLNGLWIARLLRRADSTALAASRVMGVAVSTLALVVAAFGAAKYMLPAAADWSEGRELAVGLGLSLVLGLSYLLAMRLARPVAAPHPVANDAE